MRVHGQAFLPVLQQRQGLLPSCLSGVVHQILVFHDITCSLRSLRSNSFIVSPRIVRIAIAGMAVLKPISDVMKELEAWYEWDTCSYHSSSR